MPIVDFLLITSYYIYGYLNIKDPELPHLLKTILFLIFLALMLKMFHFI